MLFSFTPAAVEVIPDEGQKPDASMRAHAHFPWVPVQPTESAGGPVTGLLAYSQSFILKSCIKCLLFVSPRPRVSGFGNERSTQKNRSPGGHVGGVTGTDL